MFPEIRSRLRLWTLRNRKQQFRREYDVDIQKAHKFGKTDDEIESLHANWRMEFDLLQEEIGAIETSLIIREGERYGVDVPIQHGNFGVWVEGRAYTNRYLTDAAIAGMRQQIRQERRERFEEWSRWTPIVSALTGLLGVIIAILALGAKR